MSLALVIALSIMIQGDAAISSDDLDAYVDTVLKARKACGPTSAWYFLRRYGKTVKLADLWQSAHMDASGTGLEEVLRLIQMHGVQARGFRMKIDDIRSLPVPAIVVLDESHCVVFEGFEPKGDHIRYYEPATGQLLTAPVEALRTHWTGELIACEPPGLSRVAFVCFLLLGILAVLSPIALAGVWRNRPALSRWAKASTSDSGGNSNDAP